MPIVNSLICDICREKPETFVNQATIFYHLHIEKAYIESPNHILDEKKLEICESCMDWINDKNRMQVRG